jgi:hypothetical protein
VPVCHPRPIRWWWPTRSPATSASDPVPNGSSGGRDEAGTLAT